ncbi:hypothetical protein ACFXDJ_01855 [Streptomyces sp. NPDC059443]|uniref:hypothetical protein n=1 Tax=unclassified Streptomyces TaxID=2593676 RepID=UPI00367F7C50
MLPDPPHIGARHVVPCAVVLLASLLCAGCGGPGPSSPAPARAAAPAPAPLDRIAEALGCRAEVTVDAEELREGACEVGPQAYRMATFSTGAGREAWLAESRAYGGAYLVGDLWIVTAPSPEALTPLHDHLGGTLESGSAHDAHDTHDTHDTHAPHDPPESHAPTHAIP